MGNIRSINIRGLTLIELLIAITIASFLIGITALILQTSFEAFSIGEEELRFTKAFDETLDEITNGGIVNYGIKDALEMLDITPSSITFVPLWVDDTHTTTSRHENPETVARTPFILNRPFKAGGPLPITEILTEKGWKVIPAIFVFGDGETEEKSKDLVYLSNPVRAGQKIRFAFQPEAKDSPDTAMTIAWRDGNLTRRYKNKTQIIPKHKVPGITLSGFKLGYFDNTNKTVEPIKDLIPNITAVKVDLNFDVKDETKQAFAFINLRNTRVSGTGLIIQQGTRLKIPDSGDIRVFTLSNVTGIKKGGFIELEAHGEHGIGWKVKIELDYYNDRPVLKKYSIEYPPGSAVYSRTVNLTLELPLNFMDLDPVGRYDYDFDPAENRNNIVNLEGDVELEVTRMDARGAALFIRP